MATIHKLTKNGATIFPATITDAVVHQDTGKTLTSMIKDYNVSELFPTEGIDGGNKYTLALAIQVLGTHLTTAEKTGGIKLTFISSVSPYPEEEYYLNKNTWSTTTSDWGQRFEVGDVVADPSGSWEPSTAQEYIDQQVGTLNTSIASETIARQTGDHNLQTSLQSEMGTRASQDANLNALINAGIREGGGVEFDIVPTQNSANGITSGGMYNTLRDSNIGFVDEIPTAGSNNLVKSGGVERFVNQSIPYLTVCEGTEVYTYHSVSVKAGHTYRIEKTQNYSALSSINIYFRIDQTSVDQQVVELHGNVDYVDFIAERDYNWLLFFNSIPTTGGTEEIYFYDLSELILSNLNEITPKVFDGIYSTATRNTIVKTGIYKNTDGFYVMLVYSKVGETSKKVQFEFGYQESTTSQNWVYRKRTGTKNQQNEWEWSAWTDKFSEISTELTNITNIFSECVKVRTTESTDCDSFTGNGIYKVNTAFDNVPEDMDNNGSLLSFKNDTDARLCHILAQNMSGVTPKLWFKTMNTNNVFGKWMRLVTNTISISYVSEGLYSIIFGKYKLNLFYTNNNAADQHNWNIGEIKLNDVNKTVIVPSGTDIIGPIKVSGDADFISGVHGSSTTTDIKVYCDGKDVTLNSGLDKTCEKIVILMIDECRREVSPQTHVFDRFVTIDITRDRIHIQNTFKNVSGGTITVERATNGGLIAVRNNILSSTSMPNLMLTEAPSSWIENKSPLNTSVIFNLINIGSIKVTNILGHEQSTYRGFYNVFVNETPIRTKSYFDIIATNTDVPANGIIAGEFEYLFE